MQTGFTQDQIVAIARNNCTRYAVIQAESGDIYISDIETTISVGPADSFWGGFNWGEEGHYWGLNSQESYPCIQCVSDWGTTTVGSDIASLAKGNVVPSVERRFRILRNNLSGQIFDLLSGDIPENIEIDFYILVDGENILEESLLIQNPIEYSEQDREIQLTAVGKLTSEIIKTGVLDPQTGEYSNIVIGDIGYILATQNTTDGDQYTTTTANVPSGANSFNVSDGSILAGSSTVTIDYETLSVSNVSSNTVYLSGTTQKSHLSGAVVYNGGATFRYDFGPGPAQSVSALQVFEDGEWIDYDGEYDTYKDGTTIYVTANRPISKAFTSGSTHTTVRTLSSTYLFMHNNAYYLNGDIYYDNSVSGTRSVADVVNFYISQPADSVFKSGYITFNFTVKRASTSEKVYAIKTATWGIDYFTPNQYFKKVGNVISTSQTIYATTGKADIANGLYFSLSIPSGAYFYNGYGSVSTTLYYQRDGNGDLYEGYIQGQLGGQSFSAGGYTTGSGYVTKTFSSLNDYAQSKNVFYPLLNVVNNNNTPFGGDVMKITSLFHYLNYYTYSSTAAAVYGTALVTMAGTSQGSISSQSGDYTFNKTIAATSFNDFAGGKNYFTVSSTNTTGAAVEYKIVDITSAVMSCTYYQTDYGYPRLLAYDPPTAMRIRIGAEGTNVNPIDAAVALMSRKKIKVDIDQATYTTCWNYYDGLSFSLNGYLFGEKTINENLALLMEQCHFYIYEAFGRVKFFINLPKEQRPVSYISGNPFEGVKSRIENSLEVSHQSVNDVVNSISAVYDADATLTYSGSYSSKIQTSIDKIGEYQNEGAFEMSMVDQQAFAELTVDYKLARNCLPFKIVSFQELYSCFGLEVGDIVYIRSDFFPSFMLATQVVSYSVERPTYNSGEPVYKIVCTAGGSFSTVGSGNCKEALVLSDSSNGSPIQVGMQTEVLQLAEIEVYGEENGGRWGTDEFPEWGGVGSIWGDRWLNL